MNLATLRHRYQGQTAAMLCGGESLLKHNLLDITFPVLTLNESWKLWPPDLDPRRQEQLHVCLDHIHYKNEQKDYDRLAKQGRLVVAGFAWKVGVRLAFRKGVRWSDDLVEGVVEGWGGHGSVAYAALQVAAWCGFSRVLMLGLDLCGGHWHGRPGTPLVSRQDEFFLEAARQYPGEVVNVSPGRVTKCTAFPVVESIKEALT